MNIILVVWHDGLVGEFVLHRPACFIFQRNEEFLVKNDMVVEGIPDLANKIEVCFGC